jgi:hypothetical protein
MLNWSLNNFLPGLALAPDLSDLCLPSLWDYSTPGSGLSPFHVGFSLAISRDFYRFQLRSWRTGPFLDLGSAQLSWELGTLIQGVFGCQVASFSHGADSRAMGPTALVPKDSLVPELPPSPLRAGELAESTGSCMNYRAQ